MVRRQDDLLNVSPSPRIQQHSTQHFHVQLRIQRLTLTLTLTPTLTSHTGRTLLWVPVTYFRHKDEALGDCGAQQHERRVQEVAQVQGRVHGQGHDHCQDGEERHVVDAQSDELGVIQLGVVHLVNMHDSDVITCSLQDRT